MSGTMSGAEADISSDGETSFEDEDVPLPESPLKTGTAEPFEVVLKGGKPWGFNLSSETKSPVRIAEVSPDSVAAEHGRLQSGDIILQVNDIRCASLEVANQLIDSAFKTLALQIWRGTTETSSSPVRSASFLQKTRELSERARQAAVQDDSSLFTQSKSASSTKMKPRQRRIESFHGGNRRHSSQAGSSSAVSTPCDNTPTTSETDTTTPSDAAATAAAAAARTSLKGWATEHDLSSSRQPVIMSGKHGTVASSRHMPLTPAKSTSNLNHHDRDRQKSSDGYGARSPLSLSTAKSTTDIADNAGYENITSPTSPKSPSWYSQKFGNRASVFDFSSAPPPRRTAGSPRHSYASGSPRNSYSGGSPRNSYASGSPRNSFSSYSSGYPSTTVTGFSPMSVPTSSVLSHSSSMENSSQRSSTNYVPNSKLTGANVNSYDDTPNKPLNKNYDRRSLPPHMPQIPHFRQDSNKESIPSAGNKTDTHKMLTSMPVTREEEELDKELSDLRLKPPNHLDLQPMCSPPAPPVRDISSLKYVTMRQNHEKFPSWPVATAQSPQTLGAGVQGAPVSEKSVDKGSDSDKKGSDSDKSDKTEVQKTRTGNKASPNGDRKSFEDSKQNRNQSDPGFKQKPKKTFYTTRKAPPPKTVPDYENIKSEEERFEDFCNKSKPGYPPPKFDPDGHNYGDEKYSIPSPPERDMPNLDEKTLVQKIAEVISPSNVYQSRPSYHAMDQSRSHGMDTHASPTGIAKIQGSYFQQALQSSSHSRLPFPQTKSTMDSGTSPLTSPSEEKNKPSFRSLTPNTKRESMLSPTDKSRGLIIRQMPYYNTSTQTDDNLGIQPKSDKDGIENQSVLGMMSQSSSSSVYHPSDVSSQSSGIGSMSLDQHSAPMLRKLSEEFYRHGKLAGSVSGSEKRMSSSSTYEELKSPRSESSQYGGMRGAESFNSVVIHVHENAGPFGSDDFGSSPSLNSHLYESDTDPYKSRRSIDSAMLLNKVSVSGSMSMPPRNLQDARFTSESNLSPSSYSWGNHGNSQSLMQLNRPGSSTGEYNQHVSAMFAHSSSTSSSRPSGSMEARSSGSGSRISSDSSGPGTAKSRTDSDSVFFDKSSPGPGSIVPSDNQGLGVGLGRKESMKLAYGTYDEHHYATPYAHQRNNSEVLSTGAPDTSNGHSRSQSLNDYLPMHYNQTPVDVNALDQIKEEGSEIRWQEAVKKSRSLSRDGGNADYANMMVSQGEVIWKGSDSDKSDTEVKKVKESKSGMRRTVSEQIRPQKHRSQRGKFDISASASTKDYNSSGESSKGNKSESETSVKSVSQHLSDSDLKRVQQKAVLDFVERKTKGSDSSDQHSPNLPESPQELVPEETTVINPPSSPLDSITKRYNYTKAQRAESLRRTMSSNSSKDSATDYMDMRRSEQRNYQTEWSRLRSMDGMAPKRPLSIGSDISGIEAYGSGHGDANVNHTRSASETSVKQPIPVSDNDAPPGPPAGSNDKMVTSPIYQNYEQDYPRRPPPPVPGSTDDQPPALPPRSQRFISSKSESFLFSGLSAKQQDDLKQNYLSTPGDKSENGTLRRDAYAEQLRIQARRLSEQPKAMPMQIVSTKSTLLFTMSQSYKQEPAPPLEALPLHTSAATTTVSTLMSVIPSESVSSVQNHSPPNRGPHTPEPPPLPTPLKNGETELDVDLNKTADFPPPPSELTEGDHPQESPDRCADDSYGSYRSSRAEPREVGKYKRTVSDSHVFKTQHKSFAPDFGSKESVDTPNKPPRKKLELKGRDSPVQNMRSSSPCVIPEVDHPSQQQMAPPHVPAFHAAETSTVHHPQKGMAKPLQSLTVQNYPGHGSGNVISTQVQRPAQAGDEQLPSVRDRVKKLEVYSHSPSSGKVIVQRIGESNSHPGEHNKDNCPQSWVGTDSLEQLESRVKGIEPVSERLGPVVRKSDQPNIHKNKYGHPSSPNERLHGDNVDKSDLSPPPQVPSRTYRQMDTYSAERPPRPGTKPNEHREPPYRSNSFQKRNLMHPQPYQNKAAPAVNPSSPPHPAGSPHQDTKRSPSQSVPEPQVPSRLGPHRKPHDPSLGHNHTGYPAHDQADIFTSPEQKVVYSEKVAAQHKDNTQHHQQHQHSSVQKGQKRSYEVSSFSKPRSYSASQSSSNHSISSATSPDSNKTYNFKSNHASSRPSSNSFSQPHGHREPVSDKGDHSNDLEKSRVKSPVNQTITYHSGDFKNWRKNPSDNQSTPRNNNQSSSDLSGSFIESENNRNKSSNNAEADKISDSKLVSAHIHHGRQPSAEELECQVKAQELARVLPESDRQLSQVLQTDSNKNRMQYMDGLFPVGEGPEAGAQKRLRQVTEKNGSEKEVVEEEKNEPTSPMPSNYYVSPPKAMIELELRKFGDTSQLCQGIGDNDTLAQKKEELLQSLEKKMALLRMDKKELLSEIDENENLGKQVLVAVESKCRSQQEKDKYKTYIEDIDKIIRLLLKLSGLLARAENTIQGLNDNTNEKIKKMTYDKRDRLHKQHEDAKVLKVDIDRRRDQVETMLRENLTSGEMDDCQYYINMKSKYTIQLQELEDKITLGNEQIEALKKSIPNVQKSPKGETTSES